MLRVFSTLLILCIASNADAYGRSSGITGGKRSAYRNVLTANVPNLFVSTGCVGLAAGLQYERSINKTGSLSITCPVYAFFANSFFFGGARTGDIHTDLQGMYAAPSLMYHPFRKGRVSDFSFGPALMFGSMYRKDREVGSYRQNPETDFERTDNLIGALITFNLELHPTARLVFAPHLSIGALSAGPTQSEIVQLGIKIGGRF